MRRQIAEKIKPSDWVVAMDEAGRQLDSKGISAELFRWREMGRDVPDRGANIEFGFIGSGRSALVTFRTDLPHYMVRVLLAECLYRAWTINIGHLTIENDFTKAPLSE